MTSDNVSPHSELTSDAPLVANVRLGHGRGWSFTPLAGKKPILQGWQKRPRETLDEAVAWASKGNVGLRTGRISGVVVIDVDPGADVSGLELPNTVTALTGRPGAYHLYYLCTEPLGNSNSNLPPHVDVKADGGQVVFPGSMHPETGVIYAWVEGHSPADIELAELPAHILQLLRKPKPLKPSSPPPSNKPARTREERYAAQALRLELNNIHSSVEGNRNDTLNQSAFSMGTLIGGGCLDRTEVEAALRQAALAVGLVESEVDATIRSGIDSGLKHPRVPETRMDNQMASAQNAGEILADEYILTPGPHTDDQDSRIEQSSAEFARQVLSGLPNDAIYRRDFLPGEIIGATGKRKWVELSVDRMRILVDTHVKLGKWVTSRKNKKQVLLYQACNKDAAGLVVAHAQNARHIRELYLMVPYPVYGPNFQRVQNGWHNGLYYDEPEDLRDLTPETNYEVIHGILHDLVVDFPFKTPADKENFFGLMLTPIVSPAIDGNRPMHLLNAPIERTGKSKLVNEVMGLIITGRDTPSMQITEREEEREKRILAMLLQGETLMHLDNLPAFIDSPALASLLTTKSFLGRVLGFSRNVSLPNNLTIIGTGNNVQASGEIAKRIVPIMIEPTSANPEARNNFHHPDIRTYARQQRRIVLECLLGLVENWLAAGRPLHANRLGGFESWSETIGGILQVNGLREWRTNEAEWRRQADPRGQEMETFVELWHEAYGHTEVTAADLMNVAEENDLFAFVFSKRSPQARGAMFGKMLRRHVDAPFGQWFIRQRKSRLAMYRLEVIS